MKRLALGLLILVGAPLFFVAGCLVLLAQYLIAGLERSRPPRPPYSGPERRGTARWQDDRGIDG